MYNVLQAMTLHTVHVHVYSQALASVTDMGPVLHKSIHNVHCTSQCRGSPGDRIGCTVHYTLTWQAVPLCCSSVHDYVYTCLIKKTNNIMQYVYMHLHLYTAFFCLHCNYIISQFTIHTIHVIHSTKLLNAPCTCTCLCLLVYSHSGSSHWCPECV